MNIKIEVLNAIHKMAKMQGVVQDTHGNVSMRDGNNVWIKPSGVPYEQVGINDICGVTLDGAHIIEVGNVKPKDIEAEMKKKRLKPSVDASHHIDIYDNHEWVGAICHTHSPYAVAFAACGMDVDCYITEHADYFGGTIRCLPYADLNNWGDKVSFGSGERAVLLERHGVLTFGDLATEAVNLAVAVENVAKKNYIIRSLNKNLPEFHDADKWHRRYMNDYGQ